MRSIKLQIWKWELKCAIQYAVVFGVSVFACLLLLAGCGSNNDNKTPPASSQVQEADMDSAEVHAGDFSNNEKQADAIHQQPVTEEHEMARSGGAYSCDDCGRKTDNPPGVFGVSMCDSCMSVVNAEAHQILQQIESGKDYTCEFCGAYASRGKGMCNSCIAEAAKLLGGG